MNDENTTRDPEQFVSYSYDIPKSTPTKDYPNPCLVLRRFAVAVQQSVWYMKMSMLPHADELTQKILDVGGSVEVFRFDIREYDAIRTKALRCLERDANRIRAYVEASIKTTTERIEKATRIASITDVNAAICFQQSALSRARHEINEAEECAVVFDFSGDVAELFEGLRKVIEARAAAFLALKKNARNALTDTGTSTPAAAVPVPTAVEEPEDDVDPSELGFGIPSTDTTGA